MASYKNSAAAFTAFPKGQNVKWPAKDDPETMVKGKIRDYNEEKGKFHIEKEDGTMIFRSDAGMKKGQGRPPREEGAAPKAKAETAKPKAQTSKKSEIEEIIANALEKEDFEKIIQAVGMMHEMMQANNEKVREILEQNENIELTLGELCKGLKDHHASMSDEEDEEPNDEEPEEVPAAKPKPKATSLLKKPMAKAAEDNDEE